MEVLRCSGGNTTVALMINQNGTPASVSLDSSGTVLLEDTARDLWSGTAGGRQTSISIGGGVTSATW
jgi:hypothetical protein